MPLFRCFVMFCIVVFGQPLWAQSASQHAYTKPVMTVLQQVDRFNEANWQFVYTRADVNGTIKARHYPGRPEEQRWTLTRLNEQLPDYREVIDYREDRHDEWEDHQDTVRDAMEDGEPVPYGLVWMLGETPELVLANETDTQAELIFRPRVRELYEEEMQFLKGTIIYDKVNNQVVDFTIAPFENAGDEITTQLKNFQINYVLQYVEGRPVVKLHYRKIGGSGGVFGGDSEVLTETYTQYEFAG